MQLTSKLIAITAASEEDATDMVATAVNVTTAGGFGEVGKRALTRSDRLICVSPLVVLMLIPHTSKGLPSSCMG